MTVHPLGPGVDASHGLLDARRFSEVCRDLLPPGDDLFDRFDDLDGSHNRYGSLDPATGLAHRAITPELLAGLTCLDLPLCRAFHCALFDLLEDIGDFDGVVATSEFFVSADARPMPAADAWLFEHPAPEPDDGSRPARHVVEQHSLALAMAIDTNPSLTFGSTTALTGVLLDGVLERVEPDRIVIDSEIEALTSVTLQLVSYLPGVATVVGGARVWAAVDADETGSAEESS
jgi:hypothetical protein